MQPLEWRDDELSTVSVDGDRYAIRVMDRRIGEIVVYPSSPGAWQRIHGYSDDDRLWSFDIAIDATSDRGRGYGSRTVRLMCEAILRTRDATRCVVDVRADNAPAITAYEKAGFRRARFLPNHDDGDGDVADAWLMELTLPLAGRRARGRTVLRGRALPGPRAGLSPPSS